MSTYRNLLMLTGLAVLLLSGCASNHPIKFRVHTDPEGAHVVYRQDNLPWIYLGVTPLDDVEVIAEERLEGPHTFSIKAMRCGYLDQAKEWAGEDLLEEFEDKGVIFWTPRLIKGSE